MSQGRVGSAARRVFYIDHSGLRAAATCVSEPHGLTRGQARVVAGVALDLRIGQLVDAPNVGMTALLPLDIFTSPRR